MNDSAFHAGGTTGCQGLTVASRLSPEFGSVEPSAGTRADFSWQPIIFFYCVYIGLIVLGNVIGVSWASSVGAAVVLVCLYGLYWRYLINLKPDMILLCIVLCIVLPLIAASTLDEKTIGKALQEMVKYYALHFTILLGLSLPLTPLPRAKRAGLLYLAVLSFLLFGWLVSPDMAPSSSSMMKPVVGIKGLLANGNNFALTAMILLFLVDLEQTNKAVTAMHIMVVLMLIHLSHTSGALLAFFVGLVYWAMKREDRIPKAKKWTTAAAVLGLVIVLFLLIPQNTFRVIDSTKAKLTVMLENMDSVLSNKPIEFYAIIKKDGQDVTSGLWRLHHWKQILNNIGKSSTAELLLGHGIGTVEVIFGIGAHNDYLRFLFQVGLIGLLLNMVIWIALYRRMEVKYRWVAVMVGFYCITENNFDNFLVMSMFALYVISAGGVEDHDRNAVRAEEQAMAGIDTDGAASGA